MWSPTWETHIPSDTCSPTWETRIPSDMCSPPRKDVSQVFYVLLPWKHISLVICILLPGKHIFLVIWVPLPARQHICILICFFPTQEVTWVVLPIEIKKSRWEHASFSLEVRDWLNLSSIFFCFAFLIEPFVLWFAFNFAVSRFSPSSFFARFHQTFT